MPPFWIRRTGFVVIALPLTLVLVGPLTHAKPGPSALTFAALLGGEGVLLALATFAWAAVAAYQEIKEPHLGLGPPAGLEPRMKVWGLAALGTYFLSWLGIVAWLVT